MDIKRKTRVKNYIKNMNWVNITDEGVRKTMKGIIRYYEENGHLSDRQISALRNTCIRSNQHNTFNSVSWHRTGATGRPRG